MFLDQHKPCQRKWEIPAPHLQFLSTELTRSWATAFVFSCSGSYIHCHPRVSVFLVSFYRCFFAPFFPGKLFLRKSGTTLESRQPCLEASWLLTDPVAVELIHFPAALLLACRRQEWTEVWGVFTALVSGPKMGMLLNKLSPCSPTYTPLLCRVDFSSSCLVQILSEH